MIRLLTIIVALSAACQAQARNTDGRYDNAQYKEWYESQFVTAPNGQRLWCCSIADGETYNGNYTLNPDGSVDLDNGVHIEAYRVLSDRANPTGHAVWWHTPAASYCFAPGPLM